MHHHAFFNDKSDVYRDSRPIYPKELLAFIAGLTQRRDAAWDCATGNGQAAIGLAAYFSVVYATDVSDNQIAHSLPHARVQYSVGGAESPAFADASLDLATVAQALHWFDYPRFWPAVTRVLKPDGVFAAWGGTTGSTSTRRSTRLSRLRLDRIVSYWAPQNRLLWDGYRDVDFRLVPIEAPSFELRMQWDLDQLFGYLHSWSATRRCMEQEGEDFFQSAYRSVLEVWGSAKQTRAVTMPLHLLVGRNV
jgi:SAM-dependent methyltransferase